MLKVSYDTKPLPLNISRMRLHVTDSFINREIIELKEYVLKLLMTGKSKAGIKELYDKHIKILTDEIEIKRNDKIKRYIIL